MTDASLRALTGLRDPLTWKWYAIPLLAIVFYVYAVEIRKARQSGEWNAVFAALTVLGMDFLNETVNGWILVLSGRSALWTTPGDTALRLFVGWNLEILFMFALSGFVYFYTLSPTGTARSPRVLGLPERWFWAIAYSVFCVVVELFLNRGGHLVWEYPFWNASPAGVVLIFLFGYFHFYVAALLVVGAARLRTKVIAVAVMYGLATLLNLVGLGLLGWRY